LASIFLVRGFKFPTQYYARDAMHSAVFATAKCPSVRLSITAGIVPSPAERKQDREM